MIHQMIESDANGENAFDLLDQINLRDAKLFAAEREEYGEIIQDVRHIMTEYFEHWKDDPLKYIRKSGRRAEHEFEIEILPGIIWTGKIDAIGRTGRGKDRLRWLVEHKSFKQKPNADTRWRDLQSSTYLRANDILGWKPLDGTCWDYVWSKPPRLPGLLKDGSMSQKNIETLPTAIRTALKSYGFDEAEYSAYIEAAKKNRAKYFERVYTPVSESARDKIFQDFITTVQEMADNHGKRQELNIERHCSWCDYEPLCRARLEGLDYDFVKERQYEESSRPEEDNSHVHKGKA